MVIFEILNSLEIVIRFIGPFIIIFGLIIGYLKNKQFFEKCGLSKLILGLLIVGGMIGSMINIPITKLENTLIFINVGGIIIPLLISGIFIYKFRSYFVKTLLLIILVTIITYLFTRANPDFGIIIEFPYYFVPILFGSIFSFIIFRKKDDFSVIPISYSTCTVGVFIGADILWLPKIIRYQIHVGYLGGFGILDMIYISGLYAIALSMFIIYFNQFKDHH